MASVLLLPGSQMVILAGAIVLMLGGLTLLAYSVRIRGQEISRRVSLVELRPEPLAAEPTANQRAIREAILLRGAGGGMSDRDQRELMRRLARFGISIEHAPIMLLAARLLAILALAIGGYVLGTHIPLLAGRGFLLLLMVLGFGIAGWFLPALVLSRMANTHAKVAAQGLPDALELLVVCVEAGLALEDGIDRVARELRHANPELAAELAQTSADLKILPSRDQALSNLSARINEQSVRSFVITLSQTLRFGTPLAQAMRVVAAEMRNDALLEMEERANRLPTLLTLPMMLFIMPTIFLVVGGPAALRVMDVFLR